MGFVLLMFSLLFFSSCPKRFESDTLLLFRHTSVSLLVSPSESDSLLLALIFWVERERIDWSLMRSWYSCVSGSIKSLDFRVKVDFRVLAFVISFVNTRFEKMPIRMERASDHLSILTETVRLFCERDRVNRPPSLFLLLFELRLLAWVRLVFCSSYGA